MAQRKWIYESPDGGKTVYRRVLGSTEKELHYVDPVFQVEFDLAQDNQLWHNIRVAAMYNQTLADMLDQVKIYYHLTNENSSHN